MFVWTHAHACTRHFLYILICVNLYCIFLVWKSWSPLKQHAVVALSLHVTPCNLFCSFYSLPNSPNTTIFSFLTSVLLCYICKALFSIYIWMFVTSLCWKICILCKVSAFWEAVSVMLVSMRTLWLYSHWPLGSYIWCSSFKTSNRCRVVHVKLQVSLLWFLWIMPTYSKQHWKAQNLLHF